MAESSSDTPAQALGFDIKGVRVTLLHNPKAGRAEFSKTNLERALRAAGHQVAYRSTKKPGWKKRLINSKDLVIVAGGDGTVGKVAQKLIGHQTPLAILPTGTANNLARSLGFTDSVPELIDQLRNGRPAGFDVGIARGPWGQRYFFESVGAGLLADYLRLPRRETSDFSREEEMTLHVVRLKKLLAHYRPQTWTLRVDGKKIRGRFLMLEAMNTRSVGPVLKLAPEAQTNDSHFELVLVHERDRETLMNYLNQRLQNNKPNPFPLSVQRFRKLKIGSGKWLLHLDADLWPRNGKRTNGRPKIKITVKESALMISRPVKSPRGKSSGKKQPSAG